jgi:hypothetical protein
MDPELKCPKCAQKLTFIKTQPSETSIKAGNAASRLSAAIYRCGEHGLWRCYPDGEVEPFRER